MTIRAVRGCEESLTENPEPHAPHAWVFRGKRVECDGVQKECENDGCNTPIRLVEDFCSDACWAEWHAKNDPETLAKTTRV